MQTNFLILIFHTTTLSLITLFCLYKGLEFIKVWLALLVVGTNLFVLKQITLFNLHVTCSDALAVGYLLGLNLIQEFFGPKEAIKTIWLTTFAGIGFLILSLLTLLYTPSIHDTAHPSLLLLLKPQLRLILASLSTFLIVQFFDLKLFSKLRQKTKGRWLSARVACSLVCSQTLDTCLFSFLGLYGIIYDIKAVIMFSLATKALVIVFSTPYVALSRRLTRAL